MKERWLCYTCLFAIWLGPFWFAVWKGKKKLAVIKTERREWNFALYFMQRIKAGRKITWEKIEGLPSVGISLSLAQKVENLI